jgi:hypothetical protein
MRKSTLIPGCLLMMALPVMAQTMYKCGNSYQDHACAPGQKGQIISQAEAPPAQPKAAVDPVCVRQGDEAKRIAWMREAGATLARAMEGSDSEDRRRLVSDVYSLKGNSLEIKQQIEKLCMDRVTERNGARPAAPVAEAKPAAASAPQAAAPATKPASGPQQKELCDKLRTALSGLGQQQQGLTGEAKQNAPYKPEDVNKQLAEFGCTR